MGKMAELWQEDQDRMMGMHDEDEGPDFDDEPEDAPSKNGATVASDDSLDDDDGPSNRSDKAPHGFDDSDQEIRFEADYFDGDSYDRS